jgi:hypothetical protein
VLFSLRELCSVSQDGGHRRPSLSLPAVAFFLPCTDATAVAPWHTYRKRQALRADKETSPPKKNPTNETGKSGTNPHQALSRGWEILNKTKRNGTNLYKTTPLK